MKRHNAQRKPPMDYEDSIIEEQWCEERRVAVSTYLKSHGVKHGQISEWPAWHVAPYVSIWAVESDLRSGWVGWWVLCGDLPTDYISAGNINHPRDAMRAIAERWLEDSALMARGEQLQGRSTGSPAESAKLAELLATRANLLIKWANDESLWREEPVP